ncbi:C40 family peptidase [Nocardia sp. CA-107356]|uniref:C40 family peptidase n=1 Tax=Nocardia sp. CA-107356 TaxID=3239972 RepID=UPI003D8BE540
MPQVEPTATGASANRTSTLGPSQWLSPGESLKNGDYTLTYAANGQLTLSSANRGVEKIWNPKSLDGTPVEGSKMYVGSDGQPCLIKDGKRVGTLMDPAGALCYLDQGLELQKDGSVVTTSRGKPVGRKHYEHKDDGIELHLYHPIGESKTLKAAIDLGELAIDRLTDPLRDNNPQMRPDVVNILVKDNLIDSKGHSVMVANYNQRIGGIDQAKDELNRMDSSTDAAIANLPYFTRKVLSDIDIHMVGPLRGQVKAAEQHRKDGNQKISTQAEMKLISSIERTIAAVQGKVDDAADQMKILASEIEMNSPDYERSNQNVLSAEMGAQILAAARQWLGTPYVWGGGGPAGPSGGGLDCSGLTSAAVFAATGHILPRTSEQQWEIGTEIPLDQVRPGDLVFSNFTSDGPGHVAIAAGDGNVIEAPQPGGEVQLDRISPGVRVKRIT